MVKHITKIVTLLVILCVIFLSIAFYSASDIKVFTAYPLTELEITPVKDETFKLANNYFISVDGRVLRLPIGFETDLASIPRAFWNIYPPQKYGFITPAIVHDYLYSCHSGFSRKDADDVFYSLLIENGVSNYTALKFYLAVRAFGISHFNSGNCKIEGGWLNDVV
jgi:hypothetical protein